MAGNFHTQISRQFAPSIGQIVHRPDDRNKASETRQTLRQLRRHVNMGTMGKVGKIVWKL